MKKVNYCNTLYLIYLSINFPQDITVNMSSISNPYRQAWADFLKDITDRGGLFRPLNEVIPEDMPRCEELDDECVRKEWLKACEDIVMLLSHAKPNWYTLHTKAHGVSCFAVALLDVVGVLIGQQTCVKQFPLTEESYKALYPDNRPAHRYADPFTKKVYCKLRPEDTPLVEGYYE